MGGVCGIRPDWAGPVVAGQWRRRDITRCLTSLCRQLTVRGRLGGWVVAGKTGRTTPVQTLGELVAAAAPHLRTRTWEDLEQLLLEVPAPARVDSPGGGQLPFPESVVTDIGGIQLAARGGRLIGVASD